MLTSDTSTYLPGARFNLQIIYIILEQEPEAKMHLSHEQLVQNAGEDTASVRVSGVAPWKTPSHHSHQAAEARQSQARSLLTPEQPFPHP